jgi:hypothetical protein
MMTSEVKSASSWASLGLVFFPPEEFFEGERDMREPVAFAAMDRIVPNIDFLGLAELHVAMFALMPATAVT